MGTPNNSGAGTSPAQEEIAKAITCTECNEAHLICLHCGKAACPTHTFTICLNRCDTYQTILNGCLKHDDLEHAVQIVDDALGLDTPDCLAKHALLNQEAIDTLIFTIQRRGRMSDLGEPLVERLRSAGVGVNALSKSSTPTSRLHAARRGDRPGGTCIRDLPRSP